MQNSKTEYLYCASGTSLTLHTCTFFSTVKLFESCTMLKIKLVNNSQEQLDKN